MSTRNSLLAYQYARERQIAAAKALVAFVSAHTSHVDAALQSQFSALLAELAQATTELEALYRPQELA